MGGKARAVMSPQELEAARRREKQRIYLREIGRPATVTGPEVEQAVSKIRAFKARGMAYVQMAEQTGYSPSAFRGYARGVRQMKRSYLEGIQRMVFEEPADLAHVDPTGASRRVQALWYDGFPRPWLLERVGVGARSHVGRLVAGDLRHVTGRTARAVAGFYDKLQGARPQDFGIPDRSVRYCRVFAQKAGLAPRSCWDAYTIDDPQAIPQWTGHCGTLLGLYIHERDGVPACPACLAVRPEGSVRAALMRRFDPEAFRALREASGIGPSRVCEIAGLSDGTVYYWETGRSVPQRKGSLEKVLSVLDATIEDVIKEREGDREGRP